ncbi:MAG: histidine kinase, partial [Chitinophagaceae bacterium]
HDPTNPSSISGNIITDILEDKNGLLWIATIDGGLTRYDYRLPPKDQFHQYKHSSSDSSSIPSNIINAVIEDQSGYLWLATSGHNVLRFDKKKEEFTAPLSRRARTYLDLAIDHKGKIWAGREGGGLSKIDPRTLKAEEDERYADVYAKLPHMTVTTIFKDTKNNMWLGSWDKVIYRVNGDKEEVFSKTNDPNSFPEDDALAFAEDKFEHIWIGGKYNGLYFYHPATQKFQQYRHDPSREGSLADNQVNCIYIDQSGIVWIGTTRGLSIYNPLQQKFAQNFIPGIKEAGHTLYDFYTDDNNQLFIGTSNGIYVKRNAETPLEHYPIRYKGEELSVTKFFRDAKGVFYIGTNVTVFRL